MLDLEKSDQVCNSTGNTMLDWLGSPLLIFQEDIELIDRMIAAGEAEHNKWRHPDPYIGMLI